MRIFLFHPPLSKLSSLSYGMLHFSPYFVCLCVCVYVPMCCTKFIELKSSHSYKSIYTNLDFHWCRGIEAGIEAGFHWEVVYFQLDSGIPCGKGFKVPKIYLDYNWGQEESVRFIKIQIDKRTLLYVRPNYMCRKNKNFSELER